MQQHVVTETKNMGQQYVSNQINQGINQGTKYVTDSFGK